MPEYPQDTKSVSAEAPKRPAPLPKRQTWLRIESYVTLAGLVLLAILYVIPVLRLSEGRSIMAYAMQHLSRLLPMILLVLGAVILILAVLRFHDIWRHITMVIFFATSSLFTLWWIRDGAEGMVAMLMALLLIKLIFLGESAYHLILDWLALRAPRLDPLSAYHLEKRRHEDLLKIRDGEAVKATVHKVRKITGYAIVKSGALSKLYRYTNELLVISLVLFYTVGMWMPSATSGLLLLMAVLLVFSVLRRTYLFALFASALIFIRVVVLFVVGLAQLHILTSLDELLLVALTGLGVWSISALRKSE